MIITQKQAALALRLLEIPVSADNVRRVPRAKTILDERRILSVGMDGADRLYKVVGTEVYDVSMNHRPRCSCPDAQSHDYCKHGIACMMLEFKLERAAIEKQEALEADRFACDGEEVY